MKVVIQKRNAHDTMMETLIKAVDTTKIKN